MENGLIVEQGSPKAVFEQTKEKRTKAFLARFTTQMANIGEEIRWHIVSQIVSRN